MSTFVFVHGAWHGGWCWRYVSEILRASGHNVFTPTLTGLGERVHLRTREIGLSVHIQDIKNVLESEELSDVILVGHSYGGMVLSGVAAKASSRLSELIYLDAFVPTHGDRALDLLTPGGQNAFNESVKNHGDGWRLAPVKAKALGVEDPARQSWVDRRCVDMAFQAFLDPIELGREPPSDVRRHFVLATDNNPSPFHAIYDRLSDNPEWNTLRLACGHDAMVIDPEGVASILLQNRV